MRFRTLLCGFAAGAATTLVATEVLSQVAEKDGGGNDLMQKWAQYALPGEHHDRFEFFEGKWDTTYTLWMEGPDKPPINSTSFVSNKLIFGGRFLESRMRGTIPMDVNGEKMEVPIEGIGYRGYDNFKKKYVNFWVDSSATGIYYSEGTSDESGKVTTFFATFDEWQSGERDKPYKMVETIVDKDTVTVVMYDLTMPAGRDRIFEERSTRRK